MKSSTKTLLSSVCLLLFIACSSDDSPSSTDNSAAVGAYQLTELNINPPQDINEDGTETSNVLTELNCVQGTLTLRSDDTFNISFSGVEVTTITGGLFKFFCTSDTINSSGSWTLTDNTVTTFDGSTTITYALNGDMLTNTISEDLPGFRSEVYSR